MSFNEIFHNVKDSFCSLWSIKDRGNTLEIISPFSTTNSKFISVFITKKNEKWIVTDGGWLSSGMYENNLDFEDFSFLKIWGHYESQYDISKTEVNGNTYYFKSTSELHLIPNLVYDLCHFLSALISISQISFEESEEKEERKMFSKKADSYISGLVDKNKLRFRREISEDYKNVRFNVIIDQGKNISLIRYITGSTSLYFINSLTKATVDFEIVNKSPFNSFINNRIALINDSSPGFDGNKVYRYMETLSEHTKMPSIVWSKKESLLEYL